MVNPRIFVFIEPFTGYYLKAVCRFCSNGSLDSLFMCAWVNALGKLFLGLLALLTGIL